jgi:hypothetical protein
LYWNPPSLELIAQPVALETFLDVFELLQPKKDNVTKTINILDKETFFILNFN